MNLNLRSFLFLIISLVVGLTSCSDDDTHGKLIREIDYVAQGGKLFLFEYGSKNKLTKLIKKQIIDGRAFVFKEDKYTYSKGGKLVKYETFDHVSNTDDYYDEFSYKGDTVFVTRKYEYIDFVIGILLLNEKKLLIETRRPYSNSVEYCSYDSNNNLIESVIYYNNSKYCTATHKYDNQKSVYSDINMPAWYWVYTDDIDYAGKNNRVKSTYLYHCDNKNGECEDIENNHYTIYIYDCDGYPTGIKKYDTEYENIFKYK
ncbi:hypothetical protein [Dysgonomonas sp. 520]|uniref:hypothetical protein n=1 Tax=Dysgonomonas sp. 520 TaxID=2302931 RepID=UPI0013CF7D05|nr:hypothetical protein [Dysgonomonas sp. 520]NDW10914.1 hypothetical protein [Dysgonomonas sp. 520]